MDAHPDAPAPGLVQVQISLSQEADKYKEVVKRASKRHELVEVNDFVFRRKRKAVALSPAHVPAAPAAAPGVPSSSPAAAIKHSLQLDMHSPPARAAEAAADKDDDAAMADQAEAAGPAAAADPAAPEAAAAAGAADAEMEEPDQQQQQAEVEEEEQQEMVPATPPEPAALQFSVLPSELCDLVEWVFFNERKKLPGTTADTARKAAAQFKEQFATQLQQCQAAAAAAAQDEAGGASTPVSVAPQLTVLPYLVEKKKSELQEKCSRLLQEEADWLQLQQQYYDLGVPAAADGEAAVPAGDSAAAEGAAGAEGEEELPAAAAVVDGAADGTQAPGEAAADAAAAAGAAAAAAAAATPESPVGPAYAQQEGTIRSVQLKVEMLVALVSKMEHLVSSAEAAARTLQMGYHTEKFKVFPHINSPAALIKSIVSSQQPAHPSDATGN